jgi:hypothetical protein
VDEVILTLDVDWAPDFIIDDVAQRLVTRGVRATWFVTHVSPAIDRLRRHPELFELGIHPNFSQGSTHGPTPEAVLQSCLSMIPDAVSMRTHSLMQSSPLLINVLRSTPIRVDVSMFLPHLPGLQPFPLWMKRRALWRVPFFWEDDFEMERPEPIWELRPLLDIGPGLKIFDFHPVHVHLNRVDLSAYQQLKVSCERFTETQPGDTKRLIKEGEGPGSLFEEVASFLSVHCRGGRVVRELVPQAFSSDGL